MAATELAGTWVFNDRLFGGNLELLDIEFIFNFDSNGYHSTGLAFSQSTRPDNEIGFMAYGDVGRVYFGDQFDDDDTTSDRWANENFKNITITSKLSEVTDGDVLLTWLQANATKQAEPATPKVHRISAYTASIGTIIANLFDNSDVNGTFNIYVKAVGSGFTDSTASNSLTYSNLPSEKLPAPSVVSISGNILTWSAVTNASNYKIYVKAANETNVKQFAITSSGVTTVNLRDFASSYSKLVYGVVYNAYVQAIAGSSGYMDSSLSTVDVTFVKMSDDTGGGGGEAEEDYYILYGGLYKVTSMSEFDPSAALQGKDILINCIIIDGSTGEIHSNYYEDNLWTNDANVLTIGAHKIDVGDLIYTGFSGQKVYESVKTWITEHMQEVVCDSNDNYIVSIQDSYAGFVDSIPDYAVDADKQFEVRFGDYNNVLAQNGWICYVKNDTNQVIPIEELSTDVSTGFGNGSLFDMVRIQPSLHGNFPSENLFNLQQTLQDETGYVDEGWQFFTSVYENVNDIYIAKDEPDLSTFDTNETEITIIDAYNCYVSLYSNLASLNHWFYSSYEYIIDNDSTWNSNIIVTDSSVKLTDISANVETTYAGTAWYTDNSWKASTFNVAAHFVNRVIAKRTGELPTSDDIDKLFEKTRSEVISVREQLYIKF